jgi:NAD(P)-dependent dehydrogenase (short-subunit alcohol dehydrogenase family)
MNRVDNNFRRVNSLMDHYTKKKFANHNVFITGATSDIGKEIAESFASLGGNLVLSDQPDLRSILDEVCETLTMKYGIQAVSLPIDISLVSEIRLRIKSLELPIHILINCAGLNEFVPALEVTEQVWDRVIGVNLKGSYFVSQSIALNMIKSQIHGKIVNIGSQHGVVTSGLRSPYCISKAGIIHMTKVLALEWSQSNILVNCVSPTFTKTSKNEKFLSDENVQATYLPKIPLKRFAVPNDIARTVLFLASPSNVMITGENILVDGGYTIH